MSENTRRPSGLEVNGVPSADEIIEMGRNNVFLAGALSYWRQGSINFDEALRLAIYYLLESNAALNRVSQDLAARAFSGPIVVEHPIRGSTDPREKIAYGKIVPATLIIGGREVADAIKPGQRVPFIDAQKKTVGYADNFRVESGKTVCDVHLDQDKTHQEG